MKKKSSFRRHASGNIRKKGDTHRLAAQLAPLEEQDKPAAEYQTGTREYGAIVVDNENLKVPTDMVEGTEEKRFFGIEPVVLVVLIIMLSFIALIAWQITLMPAR